MAKSRDPFAEPDWQTFTVAQLIAALQKLDPDLPVRVPCEEASCTHYFRLDARKTGLWFESSQWAS